MTRMMILGVISASQPVHGYDVRRELWGWRADEWATIHPGSIYHALKRLTREGLLREVSPSGSAPRPARTSYEHSRGAPGAGMERHIALAEAEAQWCDQVVARIESGVSYGADSLSGDADAAGR